MHGVVTNLPFLRALLRAPEVQRAEFDTEWVEREFLDGFAALSQAPAPELALAAAALAEAIGTPNLARTPSGTAPRRADPFSDLGNWRLGGTGA